MSATHFALSQRLLRWAVLFVLTAANVASAQQPNIVLIVADYMGYADIGPYGAKDIATPALDQLAATGVQFHHAYAAAPSCIPSRAALMSGRYPSRVLTRIEDGSRRGLIARDNVLVRELKSAGYRTALIGKWHLGSRSGFAPEDHGFDLFFGFDDWTLGYHDHLTSDGEPGLYRGRQLVEVDGYLTDVFSKEAVRFIESSANQTFFLFLSYNAGLPPYQPPDLPAEQWGEGWDANQANRADYVAMVEALDRGIGSVLDKLEVLGIADDTLVIFTYDHGGRHLVDSGPLFHGFSTLWEGGIRVPLLIRWPSVLAGNSHENRPTIAMDLTATMLDAAGRDVGALQLDGFSLLPNATRPDRTRTLFWQHGAMKAARRGNWKYLVDRHTQFLFDLDQDSGERQNQFARHPETVNRLKAAVDTWTRSTSQ